MGKSTRAESRQRRPSGLAVSLVVSSFFWVSVTNLAIYVQFKWKYSFRSCRDLYPKVSRSLEHGIPKVVWNKNYALATAQIQKTERCPNGPRVSLSVLICGLAFQLLSRHASAPRPRQKSGWTNAISYRKIWFANDLKYWVKTWKNKESSVMFLDSFYFDPVRTRYGWLRSLTPRRHFLYRRQRPCWFVELGYGSRYKAPLR